VVPLPDLIKRGEELRTQGKLLSALSVFDQALLLDPTDVDVWNHKISILAELDRHSETLQACELALLADATNTYAWYNEGRALYFLKRYREALLAIDEGLLRDPEDIPMWEAKGNTLARLWRFRELWRVAARIHELQDAKREDHS
jgi:tetratricopeptide (TPR) repeat protein